MQYIGIYIIIQRINIFIDNKKILYHWIFLPFLPLIMQKSEKFIANIVWNYPWITFTGVFLSVIIIGATAFHLIEWWRRFDSFYYAFAVMTTLWFGDFVPSNDLSKIITVLYGIIGIPLFIVGSWIFVQKVFYIHLKKYIAHVHHEIELEKKLQKEITKEIEKIERPRWKKLFQRQK